MTVDKLIKRLIVLVLNSKYARKRYYSFFYFLYLQGLRGLDHGYKYIYPKDSGELQILKEIAEYYRGKDLSIVFFDVGSNTGYYATEVMEIFGEQVEVFCFEPSASTYNQLKARLGNQVRHYQLGLSNKASKAVLHSDKEGSGMASLEDTDYAPPFGITADLREVIETDTIDNFLHKHKIGRVHFLKMDVEGHEFHVLEGAVRSLQNNCFDFIQFEFGRTNIDSRTPLKLFYKLLSGQYKIFRVISDGLVPQFEYNYEYEIYLGTNFLAVSKNIEWAFD